MSSSSKFSQTPSSESRFSQNLQIFDLHIEVGARSTQDLVNLSFFGTTRAILCAGGWVSRPPDARAVFERFEQVLTVEIGRLRAAGVTPYVALGVSAFGVPRRGIREVLGELPSYLRRASVVAVGPLSFGPSPREIEALHTQIKMAASLQLPCLVSLPPTGKLRMIAQIFSLASSFGLPPERLAFEHVDKRALLRARAGGAWSVLTIHPDHLRPETATKIILRETPTRILLNSAMGSGPSDILALPKVALQLAKAGMNPEMIHTVFYENAMKFLGLS